MVTRRRALVLGGAVLTSAVAGCTSGPENDVYDPSSGCTGDCDVIENVTVVNDTAGLGSDAVVTVVFTETVTGNITVTYADPDGDEAIIGATRLNDELSIQFDYPTGLSDNGELTIQFEHTTSD